MSRPWKTAIVWVLVVLIVGSLGLWGLWVATGRGAPIYQGLGRRCMESGNDPEAAAGWYQKAVRLRPRDAALRMDLAEALAELDRPDEALAEYREAARLDSSSILPWLGISHVERDRGKHDQALQALAEARKRAVDEPEVLRNIDQIADLTRQVAEHERKAAALDRQRVELDAQKVELDAQLAEQRELLGELCAEVGKNYEDEGELDKAIEEYEKGARCGNQECRERLAALGRDVPPVEQGSGNAETAGAAPALSETQPEEETP